MWIRDGKGIHIFKDINSLIKLRQTIISFGEISKEIHKPGDCWIIFTTEYLGGCIILRYFEGQGYQVNTTITFGVTIIVDVYSIKNTYFAFDEIAIRDGVESQINWHKLTRILQRYLSLK